MSVDTIEVRVARGAALLDEKLPGWADRIDLDRLDLGSPCRCILGQTWDEGRYDDDDPYFMHVRSLFGTYDQQRDAGLGFNINFGAKLLREMDAEYAELTAEWRRVIEARREAAASTPRGER